MIPTPKNNLPDDRALRLMIENNLIKEAQLTIDVHKLQYRIVQREGKYILEDMVVGADLWLKKFITSDPATLQMKDDCRKLAKIDDEVLILGETGTGKELIARALIGDREGKFLRVNCAAMPRELIESELFGHKAGAFTGATGNKTGMLVAAKDGVVFLDEIGDLPLDVQAKLLNVLQPVDGKRYVRPVGSNEETEISCRVICATHKNLVDMVKEQKFRLDLYARISTFVLTIRPLRERKGDIPAIAREIGYILKKEQFIQPFLDQYLEEYVNNVHGLELNVRSIEQAIKRYCVLGRI